MLLSAVMLNMLNHVVCSAQKTLLSAEMLNMLNMLNVFWPMTPPLQTMGLHGPKSIQHIQHFSRKKGFFSEPYIQHDSTYSTFQPKEAHFEKKCLFQGKKFNMAQKVVLSAEKYQHGPKSGYFSRKIQHGPKSGSFSRTNSTCAENVLLSAEMLNMLNALGVWLIDWRTLMGQKTFNIFNIFNISAERSVFSEAYIQHDSTYSTF